MYEKNLPIKIYILKKRIFSIYELYVGKMSHLIDLARK